MSDRGDANKKETCELPDGNPPDAEIESIIRKSHTIAIVGISDNPERDSNEVGRYLKEHGYEIIPVNPAKQEILGERCYPDLKSIPKPIDVVDIFRNKEAIPGVVNEAISVGAKAVWMQLGLAHHESAQRARDAGLAVVQSRCMKIEHARVFGRGVRFELREDI